MKLTLNRTNSKNIDFQHLVLALDKDLAKRNGEANNVFSPFNKIDLIQHVLVAYNDHIPIGCAALKQYDDTATEVKRMYVSFGSRKHGVAYAILESLENWARELGYKKCILETGIQMPEAIGLYLKSGYRKIPNYGPYVSIDSSICFEKIL